MIDRLAPGPRQPAYDAVFAYIRSQPRDFLPTTVVDRNAMIWHAVHAALDAVGIPKLEETDTTQPGQPLTKAHAEAVSAANLPPGIHVTRAVVDEAVRQMDADTTEPHTGLIVQPYTENGVQKWVFRCWGTDTCDGWLSLDHYSEQSAQRARDRHIAEEHGAPGPCPACRRADQAGLAPGEQHPRCATSEAQMEREIAGRIAITDAACEDDPPVKCWHTEPGTPCDWDECKQPERLAAGDTGTDPREQS